MLKMTVKHILYGLKVILMWILITNLVFAAYGLIKEFSVEVRTVNAVLGEQIDSHYDTALAFRTVIDGQETSVYTENMSHETGDTVKVILRDGKVYTVVEEYEEDVYSPFRYRFKRGMDSVGGNITALSVEAILFAVALIVTIGDRKEIKNIYPRLTTVTYALGGITAVTVTIMGAMCYIIGGIESIMIGVGAFAVKAAISAGLLVAWAVRSYFS